MVHSVPQKILKHYPRGKIKKKTKSIKKKNISDFFDNQPYLNS